MTVYSVLSLAGATVVQSVQIPERRIEERSCDSTGHRATAGSYFLSWFFVAAILPQLCNSYYLYGTVYMCNTLARNSFRIRIRSLTYRTRVCHRAIIVYSSTDFRPALLLPSESRVVLPRYYDCYASSSDLRIIQRIIATIYVRTHST